MAGITVEEIRQIVLPPGSELVAGRGGASREVAWPVTMRTRSPAFPALRGGELALISTEAMRVLDPNLSLSSVIKSLATHRVSGVVVLGDVTADALAAADDQRVPLIALPQFAHLADLEQLISRAIVDRRTEMHQRGQELYRQLTELAIEGRGIPAILERVRDITGKTVVLEDQDFRVMHVADEDGPEDVSLVDALAGGRDRVMAWIERAPLSSSDPPTARFDLDERRGRAVAPIVARDSVLGYLSVVARSDTLSEMDELAVGRGASACAIEFVRERAVLEVEDRMQSDLLDALVTGSYPSIEVVRGRAERLGFDLSAPHAVVVFQTGEDGSTVEGRRDVRTSARTRRLQQILERSLNRRGIRALNGVRGTEAVVLYGLGARTDPASVKTLAEDERRALATQVEVPVSAGVGRLYTGYEGVKLAYQEAEGALSMGQFIFGAGHTTYFGDLGLYRLLLALRGSPELETFFQEVLGPLTEYDRRNDGENVRTLEAYFACLGSPTDAAERLHVHRNTLLYRLKRIREIGGINLDDAETRLALHLALRVREVLAASNRRTG